MKNNENVVDTLDYHGKRAIFTKKKWEEKSIMHPELQDKRFLNNVKKTIENPDEVWHDYSDRKNKRCYYKKLTKYLYAKVVIWKNSNPIEVVTAFQTNYIKEDKYPGFYNLLR